MVEHVKIERLMMNKKLYFKPLADRAPENASDF